MKKQLVRLRQQPFLQHGQAAFAPRLFTAQWLQVEAVYPLPHTEPRVLQRQQPCSASLAPRQGGFASVGACRALAVALSAGESGANTHPAAPCGSLERDTPSPAPVRSSLHADLGPTSQASTGRRTRPSFLELFSSCPWRAPLCLQLYAGIPEQRLLSQIEPSTLGTRCGVVVIAIPVGEEAVSSGAGGAANRLGLPFPHKSGGTCAAHACSPVEDGRAVHAHRGVTVKGEEDVPLLAELTHKPLCLAPLRGGERKAE